MNNFDEINFKTLLPKEFLDINFSAPIKPFSDDSNNIFNTAISTKST